MTEIKRGRVLDYNVGDVVDVYAGPVGVLWEMLMGEQIHVNGLEDTDVLARKAGLRAGLHVLDVCCALGGPARHLARQYGCTVTGLDATAHMVDEARKRTDQDGLTDRVKYHHGTALDMPFKAGTFDVVWGQDAWCYVTDKARLVAEAARVLRPGGVIAFTDWIQAKTMSDDEWAALNGFMAFPYMETLAGYAGLLEAHRFKSIEKEDLTEDFARHCHGYLDMLRGELKPGICRTYGEELYRAAEQGLLLWTRAADEGKVGRGRWVARR